MTDWSNIRQIGRPLDGESVVQRQMWLMENEKTVGADGKEISMSKSQAYDKARREFYAERLQEDIERRVAKEEAEATGAYFCKSMLEVGMELEDKVYEEWKAWAIKDFEDQELKRAAQYTGISSTPESTQSQEDPSIMHDLDSLNSDAPPPI